ncbi:hypothetical protein C8R47DRAFT_1210451 [Mycena vitilis]|nr:hypothetical protein C8R47DRAFT_1210451 [Mycena vitilis]
MSHPSSPALMWLQTANLLDCRNAPYCGPWYLTIYGMLVRDSDRAHDQVAITSDEEEEDQSQCPVFSAGNFETIVKYLPALPTLRNKFKRGPGNKKQQTGNIYYVLEGSQIITTDSLEIGVRHRLNGDEWAAIHVADSLVAAHRLADLYRDVKHLGS